MRRLVFILCFTVQLAGAAELQGRLFFTPAQRAQLESARAQKDRPSPVLEGEAAPAPPAPEVVTYGGMVRRSDGKTTVWLNDKPISDRKSAASAGLTGMRKDGAITVKPTQAERGAALKVGQSLEVVSGVIEEPYARRITRITPEAKPALPAASVAPEAKAQKRRPRNDVDEDREARKAAAARGDGK